MILGTLEIARLEVDNANVKRHSVELRIVRLVLMVSMIIRTVNLAIVLPTEPSKLNKFLDEYRVSQQVLEGCFLRRVSRWEIQP